MDKIEGILNNIEYDENDTKETAILKIEKILKQKLNAEIRHIRKNKK